MLFHQLHPAKFPQTKKIPQISQAKKAGASSLQKICEEAMVGCFYDFGQCFLQPDGCSLKLPPTWSHCSPCAKVVWGLEAQVHGPTFHRVENLKTMGYGWPLRWLILTTKKEIWMIWPWKEIGVPWSLGYLVFCFFFWSSWKFQLNSFDVNDFWASAIIVFDQEINDDTPYLFFTISGDLLMRVVQYLSFYVHFDQGNAIVYPAIKWCQTDLWPNLPDRKCCHASYLQLEIWEIQWKLEQNAWRSTYIYNAYQQSYDR